MKSKVFFTSIATSAALAAGLATTPAQAAENDIASRAAASVGHYIAAQGNAALEQIRAEVKQSVLESIKPLLPDVPQDIRTDAHPQHDSKFQQ